MTLDDDKLGRWRAPQPWPFKYTVKTVFDRPQILLVVNPKPKREGPQANVNGKLVPAAEGLAAVDIALPLEPKSVRVQTIGREDVIGTYDDVESLISSLKA